MCLNFLKSARLLAMLALFGAVLAASMPALAGDAPPGGARLEPGRGIADLAPYMSYYSDPKASLSEVLGRYRAGSFGPALQGSMLDSNYAPEAWAGLNIHNDTLDDGRAPDPFVLTLSLALASEVHIYLIRSGGLTETLLEYSAFAPFDETDHSVTRLKSTEFTIAPQEIVTVLINFKFGPFQSFVLTLATPDELQSAAFRSSITYTAFYAFCISCLVFFFGFHAAMKNLTGLLFALLFTAALMLMAYIDGLLFRFVTPDAPHWHQIFGFGLIYALSGIGFLICGHSMAPKGGASRLARAVSALALLSLAGFAASLISPGTYAALFAYVLIGLMLATSLLAGREWRRQDGNIQIFALLVGGLSLTLSLAVLIAMVMGWSDGRLLMPTAIKAVYTVALLSVMISLTAHIINLRRMHAREVRSKMAALEQEAKRSQELLVAEQNYSRARELASRRRRQLAAASHDLKQPIASLRMTLDAMADKTEPHLRARLCEAFDYMEALSGDVLKDTGPGDEQDSGPEDMEAGIPPSEASEIYDVAVILGTVQQMFFEEAISKGLELRMVASSARVQTPPIVLMRIVSNLVSNAVKYTASGKVLIGVRRRARGIELWVADSGPGLNDEEIERFRRAYQKGARSKGHGLGLAVCFELARTHGLSLDIRSVKGKGTLFALGIGFPREEL